MTKPFGEITDQFKAETGCDIQVVYANALSVDECDAIIIWKENVPVNAEIINTPDLNGYVKTVPAAKENMYDQINKTHEIFGCTILFVTHDFNEAQRMADRIGIMVNGELKAIRKNGDLFERCQDEEINQFLDRNHAGSVH